MNDLRFSTILMVGALAFFFNVERLDLNQETVVNLGSFLYPLVTVASLLTIALRLLARFNLAVALTGWGMLYVVAKFFSKASFLGGAQTYVTITEIALFLGVGWTCFHVARGLAEFEQAVEEVTMKALGHRFVPLREAGERIQDEFQLSRRHAFPLSLIVVEPEARSMKMILNRMLKEAQQALISVFAIRSAASVITKTLRRTDLLLEDDAAARFIILCRDTNVEGSNIVQRRIRDACTRELGLKVASGRACFPEDALTFEELLQNAASRMSETGPDGPSAPGELPAASESADDTAAAESAAALPEAAGRTSEDAPSSPSA